MTTQESILAFSTLIDECVKAARKHEEVIEMPDLFDDTLNYPVEDTHKIGFSKLVLIRLQRIAYIATSLTKKVEKDIKGVVKFDAENYDFEGAFLTPTLNIPFFMFRQGGDWEMPIYFAIYHDGKELRGYVPSNGNYWNDTTKMAYGNNYDGCFEVAMTPDMEDDDTNAKRRFNSDYESLTHSDADILALHEDVENFLDNTMSAKQLNTRLGGVKSSGKITTEDCLAAIAEISPMNSSEHWKRIGKKKNSDGEVVRSFSHKEDDRLTAIVSEVDGKIIMATVTLRPNN